MINKRYNLFLLPCNFLLGLTNESSMLRRVWKGLCQGELKVSISTSQVVPKKGESIPVSNLAKDYYYGQKLNIS